MKRKRPRRRGPAGPWLATGCRGLDLRFGRRGFGSDGFEGIVRDAGLDPDITPHWLRHTCATWLMEAGVDMWDAAAFTGMTVAVLEAHYAHHRPDYQAAQTAAIGRKRLVSGDVFGEHRPGSFDK